MHTGLRETCAPHFLSKPSPLNPLALLTEIKDENKQTKTNKKKKKKKKREECVCVCVCVYMHLQFALRELTI